MEKSSNSTDSDLIRQLNKKTVEICQGDYSGVEELYPFIETTENQDSLSELAENFVLMATKLEAREFDLTMKIDELNEKNDELIELSRQRTEGSVVFFALISIISLFTFAIEVLRNLDLHEGIFKFILSRGTDLFFVFTALFFVFFTKLPLTNFGITFHNWKKSLIESSVVTGILILIILAIKYLSIKLGWMDGSNGLINFRILDWTFILYILIAPLQEFMARGVCITSIERNITGKYATPAVVILSALVFGIPHMTFSLSFALWSFGGGIIWGILYMRHRTILGVSISHFIIGTMTFLCQFVG